MGSENGEDATLYKQPAFWSFCFVQAGLKPDRVELPINLPETPDLQTAYLQTSHY